MSLKRKPITGNVRRVQHIGGHSGRNIPGNLTNKAGRRVQFESHNEELVMQRLDRDNSVVDYESQPETFVYLGQDGKRHTYIPDLRVIRSDGSIEIHEVTISSRRTKLQAQQREQAARQICASRGWKYVVHTEEDLPGRTEQVNLRVLQGYRGHAYYSADIARAVQAMLEHNQQINLHRLAVDITAAHETPYPAVVNTLCHMLWHRQLDFEIGGILLLIDGAINPKVSVWGSRRD